MTAINALVLPDAAHLFTDGNHDDADGRTRGLATKAHYVPHLGAAFAFTGPVISGFRCVWHLGGCESFEAAINALPAIARAEMIRIGRTGYTALLVRPGAGIAAEDGRTTLLHSGSSVKSIPSAIRFDLEDIENSGLAMMNDQRRHGPVGGYCQHSVIAGGTFTAAILGRW